MTEHLSDSTASQPETPQLTASETFVDGNLTEALARSSDDTEANIGRHRAPELVESTLEREAIAADQQLAVSSLKKYLVNPVKNAPENYWNFLKRVYKEFGIAEGVGTVSAIAAGGVAYKYGGPDALEGWGIPVAASAAETAGFYLTSLGQHYRRERQNDPDANRIVSLGRTGVQMFKTFGASEAVDTFSRPAAIQAAGMAAGYLGVPSGIATTLTTVGVGKVMGDHIFLATADYSLKVQRDGFSMPNVLKGMKRHRSKEVQEAPFEAPKPEAA